MEPETTRVVLYPFRYFDLMRRKWMKASYKASLEDIATRYGCFKLDGPPKASYMTSRLRLAIEEQRMRETT
jgi:hypothetical protein